MKKGKIDYDFQTVNNDKFTLKLDMRAGGQLVDAVFRKMKAAVIKKLRITDPKFHVDQLTKIEIDPRYLNSIKIGIGSTLKNIYAEVRKDGVNVIHDKVVKAYFKKVKNKIFWHISIDVEGIYSEQQKFKNNWG